MQKKLMLVAAAVLLVAAIGGVALAGNGSFADKEAIIQAKVESGQLDSDIANSFLAEMEARRTACENECTGEGPVEERTRLGQQYGIGGFGNGANNGSNGERAGEGNGKGEMKRQQLMDGTGQIN